MIEFVSHVTSLRRRFPILRRNRFLTAAYNETLDIKEVTWINANGHEMTEEEWRQAPHCAGLMLDGRAQPTGIKKRGEDATLLMVYNAWREVVEFTLPSQGGADQNWRLIIDTNLSETRTRKKSGSSPSAMSTPSPAARSCCSP